MSLYNKVGCLDRLVILVRYELSVSESIAELKKLGLVEVDVLVVVVVVVVVVVLVVVVGVVVVVVVKEIIVVDFKQTQPTNIKLLFTKQVIKAIILIIFMIEFDDLVKYNFLKKSN